MQPSNAQFARAGLPALCLLSALLTGCQTAPPSVIAPPGGTAAARPVAPPGLAPQLGDTLLHVDGEGSHIELHVRAAGPMAALGHSHVIAVHALAGELLVPAEELRRTRIELRFPVTALSVDDAAERAAAGGEFSAPIPDAARTGTREHMLGPGQLDAAHFAAIVLRSTGLRVLRGDASAGEGELDAEVMLLGRSVALVVPLRWQRDAAGLVVRGELRILQSALGLQPYSVGGGALRVADAIEARFQILAR